jgi:hypothetical protein
VPRSTMGGDGGEHPTPPDLSEIEVEAWITNDGLQPLHSLMTVVLPLPRHAA